ncbi:hypothetical protein H0H92_003926 [Tricholoma furcatifolium]|nr:hypothetical protein H0H92_003926 [Tricholoma furcatifolium]
MVTLPQRPLRGSRISSFYPVKSLPSLASLDSAFQLQEYISLLIRLDVHDVESIVSLPGKRAGKAKEVEEEKGEDKEGEDSEDKGKSEVTVDEACWIYEQLRRLAQDLTHPLITSLQQECTRASCPEMKAGEWLYLCVAHGTDGNVEQCCAIDYILHTLDSATALLNTPRAFPSRLQIPPSSHRHFSSLARRLGRIFAHAYFHHREVFEQAEVESSLYARFLALTAKFDLVPAEFLVIPTPSSSGSDSDSDRELDDRPEPVSAPAPRVATVTANPQIQLARRESIIPIDPQSKSNSPPGLAIGVNGNGNGNESPRKVGRNRTDTMVLHDAYAVAEELAKASPQVPATIDIMDEPMSPVDADELPKTAKLEVESLEETGSSLPESPTLHSPSAPSALSLRSEEEKPAQEELEPASETTTEMPAAMPVEADIAEAALVDTKAIPVEAAEDVVTTKAEATEEAKQSVVVDDRKEETEAPAIEVPHSEPEPEVKDDKVAETSEAAIEEEAPSVHSEPEPEPEPEQASAPELREAEIAPASTNEAIHETEEAETIAEIPDETEDATEAVIEGKSVNEIEEVERVERQEEKPNESVEGLEAPVPIASVESTVASTEPVHDAPPS